MFHSCENEAPAGHRILVPGGNGQTKDVVLRCWGVPSFNQALRPASLVRTEKPNGPVWRLRLPLIQNRPPHVERN